MSLKRRKQPTRTCVACRATHDKRGLLRVVRTPEGEVRYDPSGRAAGRGAYVCARDRCVRAGLSSGRLAAALGVGIDAMTIGGVDRDLEQACVTAAGEEAG